MSDQNPKVPPKSASRAATIAAISSPPVAATVRMPAVMMPSGVAWPCLLRSIWSVIGAAPTRPTAMADPMATRATTSSASSLKMVSAMSETPMTPVNAAAMTVALVAQLSLKLQVAGRNCRLLVSVPGGFVSGGFDPSALGSGAGLPSHELYVRAMTKNPTTVIATKPSRPHHAGFGSSGGFVVNVGSAVEPTDTVKVNAFSTSQPVNVSFTFCCRDACNVAGSASIAHVAAASPPRVVVTVGVPVVLFRMVSEPVTSPSSPSVSSTEASSATRTTGLSGPVPSALAGPLAATAPTGRTRSGVAATTPASVRRRIARSRWAENLRKVLRRTWRAHAPNGPGLSDANRSAQEEGQAQSRQTCGAPQTKLARHDQLGDGCRGLSRWPGQPRAPRKKPVD